MAKLSVPVTVCGFEFVAGVVEKLAARVDEFVPKDATAESKEVSRIVLTAVAATLRKLETEYKEAYQDGRND